MALAFKAPHELTPLERLDKAVLNILKISQDYDDLVCMPGVLQIGTRIINDDIPTARTDGFNEEYSGDFIKKCSDPQLRGTVLHENLHKMLKHLIIYRDMHLKYGMAINVAEDFYIGMIIKRVEKATDGYIAMPPGQLYDPKYDNMSVIEIFRDLMQQQQGDNPEDGDQPGDQPGAGKPCNGDQPGGGGSKPLPKTLDEHDYDGQDKFTEEELKEKVQDIDDSVRQGSMTAGRYGKGSTPEHIKELLKPKIDWGAQMRDYATVSCKGKDFSTWSRPNRRFMSSRIYMPTSVTETVREFVIAPDMSESTRGMRDRFFTEVFAALNTLRPEIIHLMYWDTGVHHEKYTMDELDDIRNKTAPVGGGGTRPDCVPQYMRDHNINPDCAVVLTDGYVCGWGDWHCPVFWLIVDNPHAIPPVGKYASVSREDI